MESTPKRCLLSKEAKILNLLLTGGKPEEELKTTMKIRISYPSD